MAITIKNLRKSFGENCIFPSLSYTFPDRGIVVIRGRSGIGKTTLLRLIAGLDKDYSGEILFSAPGSISFAFQEHRLIPHLNAIDNVVEASFKNPSDNDRSAASSLLAELGITKSEQMLYPSELSGGMKGRVSFARAVLRKSNIILLDEPTKELDDESARVISQIINREAKTRLVILVTHTLDTTLLDSPILLNLD